MDLLVSEVWRGAGLVTLRSQNQENYQQRFSSLEKDHAEASTRYQAVAAEIESKQGRVAQMRHHLNMLGAINPPVTGDLNWAETAAAGTVRSREAALNLAGSYTLDWAEYSEIPAPRNGEFRMLIVEISPANR